MNNSLGITDVLLPKVIGATMDFDETEELMSINVLSGELGIGFLLFDTDGTLAVCSQLQSTADGDPIYTFRTSTINAEIDITNLLSQSY